MEMLWAVLIIAGVFIAAKIVANYIPALFGTANAV